ncbi:MAG: hypothetical protein WCK75_11295 [Elusimicrobiota bacterium]
MFKFLVILLMSVAPAVAQVYLGGGLSPDSFTKEKEMKLSQGGEDAFAEAFVLENSTASLYAVFESTTPARVAASRMRNGIYRQELLILYAIARDSKTTFTALSGQREKGVSLREIARENKADLIRIFLETEELQKRIDVRAAFINISSLTAVGLSTPPVSTDLYENK